MVLESALSLRSSHIQQLCVMRKTAIAKRFLDQLLIDGRETIQIEQ
jgi:hypothetical protein